MKTRGMQIETVMEKSFVFYFAGNRPQLISIFKLPILKSLRIAGYFELAKLDLQ